MRYIAIARIGLFSAVIGTSVACNTADRELTGPAPSVRSHPEYATAPERRGELETRGAVTVTVRKLRPSSLIGDVVHSSAGTFVARTGVDGNGVAAVTTSDGPSFDVTFATASRGNVGGGTRRTFRGRSDGVERSVTFHRQGAAPASESVIERNGVVIGRVAYEWDRTDAGWQLRQQVTTVVSGGSPIASITLRFATLSTTEVRGLRNIASTSRRLAPDVTTASFEEFGPDCSGLMNSMEDAFITYEAACVAMIGCFAGPWACGALTIAALTATVRLEVAENRVLRCLAAT